ncbi:1-deoxy-D-xylulose-5-phosphate reductoisomerase [bacterium]|nr:1-deoxy-D-xylulose-5-phosphate reductoisomerase [bacterium]RQV99145.1 MAG: 1-deoxy-D-xylulose-5-phosphate reductoisomerase [bacterium]
MRSKNISIWGSTGSIGRQTLDVISRYADRFDMVTLTAHQNVSLAFEQAKQFHPRRVVITGKVDYKEWARRFEELHIEFLVGKESLIDVAGCDEAHLVVNALVGSVGLEATLKAIQAEKTVALANKEVLVMAGKMVVQEANKRNVRILPIDSEHSALFQCLRGEDRKSVRRLILTASGGPFYNRDQSEMDHVTVEEALNHPNWSMGKKVTIDSATLMNKGLEIIEARWLFEMDASKIEVVIHPQSIIHSMVEFMDGSIKAQLGLPDMRTPISYALTYPERWAGDYGWMDFTRMNQLTFLPPDPEKYPALRLAYDALKVGGTAPAVLNAADEVAVDLFLSGRIQFNQITEIIDRVLQYHEVIVHPEFQEILNADRWTRKVILKKMMPNL